MEAVAERLPLATYKKFSSKRELRYGTKGSLSIDLTKGTFYDHETLQGGGVLDLIERYGHSKPINWLRDQGLIVEDSNKHAFQIDASFDYKDENGKLLFQVCRPDKSFWQRRPNGHGKWINSLKDKDKKDVVRRVLYRLPELLAESGGTLFPKAKSTSMLYAPSAYARPATPKAQASGSPSTANPYAMPTLSFCRTTIRPARITLVR